MRVTVLGMIERQPLKVASSTQDTELGINSFLKEAHP